MFVRFQVRPRTGARQLGGLIVCNLMEAYRNDEGKPRQRSVAYLGSIRERMPPNHRIVFWENLEYLLAGLNLEPQAKDSILAKVQARIPKATRDDWETTGMVRKRLMREERAAKEAA